MGGYVSQSRKYLSGLVFAVVGTVLVFGTVIMMNRLAKGPDQQNVETATTLDFEKRNKPKPQRAQKPPPQKPKRAPRTPPAPLVNLDSSLRGLDLGIPAFSTDELGAMQNALLGDTENVVMTDDSVDAPPRPTYQAPVAYPVGARAQGQEGYVVLSLLISVTGDIEKIEVLESQPNGVFDQAAIQGVQKWRFEPATYQGRNVRVWAKQRVRFDLT